MYVARLELEVLRWPGGGRSPSASTVARLEVRDRARRAPRRPDRASRSSRTTPRRSRRSSSDVKRNADCSAICTSVVERSCASATACSNTRTSRSFGVARLGERQRGAGELLDRQAADVLAVHPLELLRVEAGGRMVDARDVELGDDLLDVEDLAVVFRRPSEQRQVVHQGMREISGVAVLLDVLRAVPLRQLGAAGSGDERQVGVYRRFVGTEGARGARAPGGSSR